MHVMSDSELGSDHWPISVCIKHPTRTSHSLPPNISHLAPPTPAPPLSRDEMEGKYDDDDDKHTPHTTQPPHAHVHAHSDHDVDTGAPLTELYVRTSNVPCGGYGLFANRRYKEGERITRYTGEVIDETEKRRRYPSNEGEYVMHVKHDMYIDAIDPHISSIARYINSSGGGYNNAQIRPHHTHNTHHINIVATRDIAPGEEIYMPYGSAYRMTRASPPSAQPPLQPQSHWAEHMTAPHQQRQDGRKRWRINDNVDWKMFQQHIDTPTQTWMQQYKHWMPPTQQPDQQHARRHNHTDMRGTLHVYTYTDGASKGNPGIGSCGGAIYLARDMPTPLLYSSDTHAAMNKCIYEFGTYLGTTTNNEAEYKGLIQALEVAIQMGATHVTSYVDSQLVCKQVEGKYQVKHKNIIPLHSQCMTLISQLHKHTIRHVLRAYNSIADGNCNAALAPPARDMRQGTFATNIPDMSNSTDHGLSDEQQRDLKAEYEQAQKQEQEQQQDAYDAGTRRPARITQTDIDTCWKQLHDTITDTAQACMGTVTVTSHSKYWWALAPNIHALHSAYRRKRRVMYRMKHNTQATAQQRKTARREYLDAREAFTDTVTCAKWKEWNEIAAACDVTTSQHKHKVAFNKFKRTKTSTRVAAASFPDAQGVPPRTHTQALNNMAAFISNISSIATEARHDATHDRMVKDYIRNHIPDTCLTPHAPSFTLSDVEKACTTFRLNTALGSDNISPYFLRYGGAKLLRAVYMLFSICSWYGMIPTSFRHGHVMTLYKGDGDATDPNNYRPITITSVMARVYERVHKQELLDAMIMVGIPSPDQFGFTKQRSTYDAIYRLLSHVVETNTTPSTRAKPKLEQYVPAVFIDISKAYDKVWIDGLLYKLHHDLGIKGNLFYMIRAMLKSRTIQVVCDGKISLVYVLEAGVLQGSVLAPLLFLIYIHGLTTSLNIKNICMSLFADDIALLPLLSGRSGVSLLSTGLNRMSRYAQLWKITFSSKKTNAVYFKPGHKCVQGYAPPHVPGILQLTGFNVTSSRMYTYLGVILDDTLSMIPHAIDLIKRIRTTATTISRIVRSGAIGPSIPVIQRLVSSILIPQMIYGFAFLPSRLFKDEQISTAGVGLTQHNTKRVNIHSQLKRAMLRPLMRAMGLPYNTHHDSLFVEARLLSITSLRSLACASLAHRWLSNNLDTVNDAGRMFRAHAYDTTLHPSHPFTHISQGIAAIPAFSQFTSRPLHLISIERHKLRPAVWAHQYTQWHTEGGHPLHQQYTQHDIPIQRNMPTYMHMDRHHTAPRRARLRLARARLRFDQKRMKFKDVTDTTCRQCHHGDETVKHVLEDCTAPLARAARDSARRQMEKLCDKHGEQMLFAWNLLQPCIKNVKNKKALVKAHAYTGRLINKLRKIWDF
jgi:ribonuclease HI